jgi:hypothetical protein
VLPLIVRVLSAFIKVLLLIANVPLLTVRVLSGLVRMLPLTIRV